ncbi:hypothetical protein LTR10_015040 [Elasticomyces elasticus]|uniref:DUF3533 domain-containing protein n=1 Tax=Exophiala sideris TaxID=1016849 RepID=A0ABR0JRF9_9EURO|nr:hypothetical protein LTR10_015040 [Elasticomyces elasticus]KAK5034764.1 hypothetical protein LTR13_006421 [Exophiala sideris]KAK5039916.1 hypothetical protein LTS07_000411 [Exophiala sideris]KAK5068295.1 hypothetical protein LTR69_000413 [Exophiala sideris]KAK5187596.1 hypothetical protein LTR44_000412 [Eurotiomycetes sp. CCFEE 6388]
MSSFYAWVTSSADKIASSTSPQTSLQPPDTRGNMAESRRTSSERTLEPDRSAPSSKQEQAQEGLQEGETSTEHQQDQDHQGEKDEEKNDPNNPPLPVGLLHPSLRKVWLEVSRKWALTVLILFTFILTVLSLYWAVLFHVEQNTAALTVAVVSFDGQVAPYEGTTPLIGQVIQRIATEQAQIPKGMLGFKVQPPSMYNNDPLAVRQAVYDEHHWAAIIVNANATTLLQQAVATGNASYSPLGAAQIIINTARDQDTYYDYIIPLMSQFETLVSSTFGEQWIQTVLSNTSLSATTYARAPQALNPAIGFSTFDLRPFYPYQVTPSVTIGLIYLIIIAFFSFSFFLPVYTKFLIPKGHPPMHFWQLILVRLFATTAAYCLMSLAYSLVSLAFQIPFSNNYPHNGTESATDPDAYGHATFVVYWMLNWVGMYALGLASENVTMVIGQPWTAFWLIFWVISNVATAFYAIPLAPAFFKYGYAWPLYHIVTASRTIIFDTHSRIGLNFGVLFVWCAVNTVLFPFCCVFMRWKTNKELARKVPRRTIQYLVDG